jgi:putative membrane protein
VPDDPDRRTSLAGERTLLAWWRTGFTAIAVALAVGRVLPELAEHSARWPYVVVGTGFALYGIALIAFGTRRIETLNAELGVPEPDRPAMRSMAVLAFVGVLLGIATIALIIAQ